MPADRVTRKTKPKTKTPANVPDLGDPDRKRVLNVLAQRRYRERKKAKFAALEAQARGATPILQGPAATPDPGVGIQNASIDNSLQEISNLPQVIPIAPDPSLEDREDTDGIEEIVRDAVPQEENAFDLSNGFGHEGFDFDAQLLEDISFDLTDPSSLPRSRENTPGWASSSTTSLSSVGPLSPDGRVLEIPILAAIQAFTHIANVLDIMNKVWDPACLHTMPPIEPAGIPANLLPTTAQMTIPHHPLLDALPWPSVREKLICMFSLPSMCRPPIAQDDDAEGPIKAIRRLVTDLDDPSEGIRIHGNVVGWEASNELAEEAWEIGEVFYRNWWWCLDNKIIAITNRRRKERGLEPLIKMY